MDKSELLQLQTNANQPDNSTFSDEIDRTCRLELEQTPYYVVGNVKEGYCITFGKYKISEQFGTGLFHQRTIIEQAFEYLDNHKWNIMFHTQCAIIETHQNITKDTNKNQ